jgi:hypothetical protein
MKRASYREAIKWIARNDESANDDDFEATRNLVSVCLIADLFDVATEIVAQEVHRVRAKIKAGEARQMRHAHTYVEVASLKPRPMTFEQFQASGKDSDDLSRDCQTDEGLLGAGRVYEGGCYIQSTGGWPEEKQGQGKWHLHLGNMEWVSDDLPALERKLYRWALSEGYCG